MLTWYLIMGSLYIGPMSKEPCIQSETMLRPHGVLCLQAESMRLCDVPDHPGTFTSCPVFNRPQVTVR